MKITICSILLILCLASCEKNVTVDIPDKEPKLVLGGFLPKDSVIRVFISRSRNVLDPRTITSDLQNYVVANARALVYEDNQLLDSLAFDSQQYFYYSINNKKVSAGKTYTIKVDAPGFKMAEATTVVPSQSTITEVSRVKNARTNADGIVQDEVIVKFDDPASETNFYLLQFYRPNYGYSEGNPLYCVSTTDKDIEPIGDQADPFSTDNCYDGGSLLLRDTYFNGKLKTLRFFIHSFELEDQIGQGGQVFKPFVKLNRITEDQFKYIKSYHVYYNAVDNPFAEPANVFSNVKNGYGIFSAFTTVKTTIP